MVHRNIKKAPVSVKEQIYKTVIRPQLEYAYCMWSPWLKQDILELEKVQRCAARFVYNNYWVMASVTEIISSLKLGDTGETSRKGTTVYVIQNH